MIWIVAALQRHVERQQLAGQHCDQGSKPFGQGRGPHEIDMRLALLDVLPGAARVRTTSLGPLTEPPAAGALAGLLAQLARAPSVVLNVGARLADKRLDAATYAELAGAACELGAQVCVTYGPAERELALALLAREPRAQLAPPTDLIELAAILRRARAVLTCDTGPMHLAVALGVSRVGVHANSRVGIPTNPSCPVGSPTPQRPLPLTLILSIAGPRTACRARVAQDQHCGGG